MRIGHGYDVHKLELNRKLIIGGVEIEYKKGLAGHSDADVLVHAVIDSLLGASASGDIGKIFPDTDKKYEGIRSIELLEETGMIIKRKGFSIVNIDATVVAQEPKLSPYISDAIRNISEALKINADLVNIKATTEEGMGFTGKGEGISAYSVCLIENSGEYGGKNEKNNMN